MIGYSRGSEVVGSHVHGAGAAVSAVAAHKAVSVDPRRVRVGNQLHLHPGHAHKVMDLTEVERIASDRRRIKGPVSQERATLGHWSKVKVTSADLDSGIGPSVFLTRGPWEPAMGGAFTLVAKPEAPLNTHTHTYTHHSYDAL